MHSVCKASVQTGLVSDTYVLQTHRPMSKQDYILKNRQWLEEKSKEQGVKQLDRGICYKVLNKGNGTGVNPNRGSVVTVHYTGKTINGKTFDSSRGGTPPAFRLRDLIPGWSIALCEMRPGDRWEVYIPADVYFRTPTEALPHILCKTLL